MKPHILVHPSIVVGLALGVAAACSCSAADRAYFPTPKQPTSLYVISQNGMAPGEMLMVTTTQGVLAKDEPLIYVTANESYEAWIDELKARDVQLKRFDDPWSLMKAVLPRLKTKGYVLADLGKPSVNAATAAAGVLGLPVVVEDQRKQAEGLGLKMVLDARGKDVQWAFKTYKDKLNRSMLFQQDPSKPHLRDYAVFNSALVFYDEPKAFVEEVMAWAEPDSPLFGWGPGDESQHVNLGAKHGLFTIPADWALDITALAAFKGTPLKQPGQVAIQPSPDPAGTKAQYVTFAMTDGDNVQWALGGLYHDSRWYGSALRGDFPMAWTMAPSLVDLASPVMGAYYQAAKKDTFIAGVSGVGYMYPSSNPALSKHVASLASYMDRADMQIATVMDLGSFRVKKVQEALQGYAALDQVKAGIYVNYGDYAGDKGAIGWLNGKPFVTARFKLWEGDPTKMAADINKLSRDVTSTRAYTLVWVHAWSHTLDDVQTLISNLEPGVKVVGINEFMGKVIGNLKP